MTMANLSQALDKKAKLLVIDFVGLQGFSAKEIVGNLSAQWVDLRAEHISFPDMDTNVQIFPEVMARALEVRETRVKFSLALKAILGDADYIAMPAILGIHAPDKIHQEMEALVGVPIFEIPTIPPAVAGIRLRELFEHGLHTQGATVIAQKKVEKVRFEKDGVFLFLEDSYGPVEIHAKYMLLASGRFLSGGLKADQHSIKEALLDIPVHQPEGRENWFSEDYFDPEGHAINRSGLLVDGAFQPLDQVGKIFNPRLYAAGIVLSHQDWIRQRCGAGIAIATAYKAIEAIVSAIRR
jgi:glycerol-3-phosphate dehydrogenase subunit B